jgi:hypothetical protein
MAVSIAKCLLADQHRPPVTLEEARQLSALHLLDEGHGKAWAAVTKVLEADDIEVREAFVVDNEMRSASERARRVLAYRAIVDRMRKAS